MRKLSITIEEQQDKLDRQIIVEKSKVAVKVTEKEMREFYVQALRCEPQMLINTLVKEIVLYDDKIEIYFNRPLKVSPDNSQGFSFVYKTVKISYRTSQWCEYRQMTMDIEMKI